jgi:hypothetical protein
MRTQQLKHHDLSQTLKYERFGDFRYTYGTVDYGLKPNFG